MLTLQRANALNALDPALLAAQASAYGAVIAAQPTNCPLPQVLSLGIIPDFSAR